MYKKFGKRLLDLLISLAAQIAAFPAVVILALISRATMGPGVMFVQERPGAGGKPFNLFKFRTMSRETKRQGKELSDGERLKSYGTFFRRTSLDELPELWNVIKGDMSLVGPRPLLMQYLERYSPEQARRHEVKPGITGWAQVNGRNALTWEERFKLDVWYVDHVSFWLDAKILTLTLWKVIKREGINQPGHQTTKEFMGVGHQE
jgi:sugar transferase EpsL